MDEFEKLLSESKGAVERFVKFKINNHCDSEDIIQDVCLTALQRFGTLKNKACFKAWLISIAKNKCNDYYRRKAANMEINIDALSETELSYGSCPVTERTAVSETLERLGSNERQLLYLYFFRELSQKEIAMRLHIPIGTVKSRLYHAKEKFKESYPYPPEPKGEKIMKKFPDIIPEYKIEAVDEPAFPVVFEELPNWVIIPRIGEKTQWASYDQPSRKMTEKVCSEVVASAFIHGIEGVEIVSRSSEIKGSISTTHSSPTRTADGSERAISKTARGTFSPSLTEMISLPNGDTERTTSEMRPTCPQPGGSHKTGMSLPFTAKHISWTSREGTP